MNKPKSQDHPQAVQFSTAARASAILLGVARLEAMLRACQERLA